VLAEKKGSPEGSLTRARMFASTSSSCGYLADVEPCSGASTSRDAGSRYIMLTLECMLMLAIVESYVADG